MIIFFFKKLGGPLPPSSNNSSAHEYYSIEIVCVGENKNPPFDRNNWPKNGLLPFGEDPQAIVLGWYSSTLLCIEE